MRLRPLAAALLATVIAAPVSAQTFRTTDTTIRRIWSLGMDSSQYERLAQVLDDSIGQRLSGTTGFQSAVDWLTAVYRSWGVNVRQERYGTTRGWRMGPVSMALLAPHVQTLDVHLMAWSPGTNGRPVDGDAVALPLVSDSAAGAQWLRSARGKFVLVSPPEIMCRAPQELQQYARPATVQHVNAQRDSVVRDYFARVRGFSGTQRISPFRFLQSFSQQLQDAGVAGIVTADWSGGWGVDKIFGAYADRVPTVELSCEDYGLVWRLASHDQSPRLRLTADAEARPDQPMFDVIAELPGTELPNEYVLLAAHLDSWHGATGATDNGTGTIMMLEAMRILHLAYPHPRRTILVGHWGGEEQGERGSAAFAEDHPDIMNGMQVMFNQDNGTWRVELIEGQGFANAGPSLARWLQAVPAEISGNLKLDVPGPQDNSGSDHSMFLCLPRGVPAFRFQSNYTEYRQYTWHTNRDTFDKLVFDDLRNNATLAAMMAYEASEDSVRVPRERTILPPGPNGQPRAWPQCPTPRRDGR